MRMAEMVRPAAGTAEATKLTGDPTVAPLAGDETAMPVLVEVDVGVVLPPTVIFTVLLKTVPAAFQACTMAVCPPAARGSEVLMEVLLLLKLVLLKVYMLWPST